MVFEEETCKGDDDTKFTLDIECSKNRTLENGSRIRLWNDVSEGGYSVNDGFQTYKRRKQLNSSSQSKGHGDGRAYIDTPNQLVEQVVKKPRNVLRDNKSCEQVHLYMNGVLENPQNHWRNVALKQIHQSLRGNEGGIQHCIQDAVHSRNDCATGVGRKCDGQVDYRPSDISHPVSKSNGTYKADDVDLGLASNGSLQKSYQHTLTERCQHALFNVIVSQQFASLCKLLYENFQGINANNFFDFSLINSRIKDGAYENSPMLFSSDVQQIWGKIQGIGTELISLAASLSDMSRTAYHEQFRTWESNDHTKAEQTEDCGIYKFRCCGQCGEQYDGREHLVCDSCEEIYHLSCINTSIEGNIPHNNWLCANCTACGIGSPHEKCVACERLNSPKNLLTNGINGQRPCQVEDYSNWVPNLRSCRICGNNVEQSDKLRKCSYPYCPNIWYHVRCLTSKQLRSYGPQWYCPSCLCRVCLTDCDDDQIALCDGCEHAYHIYCMEPSLTSVPRGKWFCRKCSQGILAIREAREAYEKFGSKLKRKGEEVLIKAYKSLEKVEKVQPNEGSEELDKGGGGMDMLLTAAKTLNYEENLAAFHPKR